MARAASASSDGMTKIRAATGMSAPSSGVTVDTSSADSQLMITPSASLPASRSIPGRRAARKRGGGCSTGRASRNPLHREGVVLLVDLLPGQGGAQEADGVADPPVGLGERHAVPPADDHVRRGPEAQGEPPRCRLGHGRHALGQQRRAPGVGGDDGHAQLQRRGPGRRQGQRGEPVGPVRLRRPDVGVAQAEQFLVPPAVIRQRHPVEGDGDPVALARSAGRGVSASVMAP